MQMAFTEQSASATYGESTLSNISIIRLVEKIENKTEKIQLTLSMLENPSWTYIISITLET